MSTETDAQDDTLQEIEDALDRFATDLAIFNTAARDAADEVRANGAGAPADRLERVTERLAEEFDEVWMMVREANSEGGE